MRGLSRASMSPSGIIRLRSSTRRRLSKELRAGRRLIQSTTASRGEMSSLSPVIHRLKAKSTSLNSKRSSSEETLNNRSRNKSRRFRMLASNFQGSIRSKRRRIKRSRWQCSRSRNWSSRLWMRTRIRRGRTRCHCWSSRQMTGCRSKRARYWMENPLPNLSRWHPRTIPLTCALSGRSTSPFLFSMFGANNIWIIRERRYFSGVR